MFENLKKTKVWIIEDELDLCEMLTLSLIHKGYDVTGFSNPFKFIEAFDSGKTPDVVITDIRFPFGLNGRDVLKSIKAKNVFVPSVIVVTAYEDYPVEVLYNDGAESVLIKPFDLQEIAVAVSRLALPFRDRFDFEPKELFPNLTYSRYIPNSEIKNYKLGRGGLCIAINQRLSVGEIVNFTLDVEELDNIVVEILGIVRWENLRCQIPEYGIEIIKMNPIQPFLKLIEGMNLVPYIPNRITNP